MLYWDDQESDQNGVGENLVLKPRLCRSRVDAGAGTPLGGRVRVSW